VRIFSDDLHYILKGNKIIKCCVDQINEYRQAALYSSMRGDPQYLMRSQYLIRATNLPKSFGFLVNTEQMPFNSSSITFKGLLGRSYMSRLYFNFNFNNFVVSENKHCYAYNSTLLTDMREGAPHTGLGSQLANLQSMMG
jgi:hypothetical protein